MFVKIGSSPSGLSVDADIYASHRASFTPLPSHPAGEWLDSSWPIALPASSRPPVCETRDARLTVQFTARMLAAHCRVTRVRLVRSHRLGISVPRFCWPFSPPQGCSTDAPTKQLRRALVDRPVANGWARAIGAVMDWSARLGHISVFGIAQRGGVWWEQGGSPPTYIVRFPRHLARCCAVLLVSSRPKHLGAIGSRPSERRQTGS
jgi:hypothetical protein